MAKACLLLAGAGTTPHPWVHSCIFHQERRRENQWSRRGGHMGIRAVVLWGCRRSREGGWGGNKGVCLTKSSNVECCSAERRWRGCFLRWSCVWRIKIRLFHYLLFNEETFFFEDKDQIDVFLPHLTGESGSFRIGDVGLDPCQPQHFNLQDDSWGLEPWETALGLSQQHWFLFLLSRTRDTHRAPSPH